MFQYNKFSSSGQAGSDYSEQTHSRKRDEAMALCGTRLLLDFSIDIKYRPLHAINLMFTSRTQKKTENAISFALISYSVSAEAEAENAAFQSNLTLHYDYIFFLSIRVTIDTYRGSISSTFYKQLLHAQIPKVQKRQSSQGAF